MLTTHIDSPSSSITASTGGTFGHLPGCTSRDVPAFDLIRKDGTGHETQVFVCRPGLLHSYSFRSRTDAGHATVAKSQPATQAVTKPSAPQQAEPSPLPQPTVPPEASGAPPAQETAEKQAAEGKP